MQNPLSAVAVANYRFKSGRWLTLMEDNRMARSLVGTGVSVKSAREFDSRIFRKNSRTEGLHLTIIVL